MSLTIGIVLVMATYIWGSIPYGYILTRIFTGKNILELGSGNVGATNVGRVAGKKLSFITQNLDILKGFLPVALFLWLQPDNPGLPRNFVYCLAFAAIIGHDFSLFLRFKGGKGVATTIGASVLPAPFSVLVAVILFFAVKRWFKFASLGSLTLAISMPLTELILHGVTPDFYFLSVCAVLIILVHYKNINRLLHGKELSSDKF
jgi:acyl phosphate:glycerol-3-phosphate acyltransferase